MSDTNLTKSATHKHRFGDNSERKSAYDAKMELKNPCVKEHNMTMKCLDENGYDRTQCEKFYENYRNCKKFWSWIYSERKRKGIQPYLPAPEDRERVKNEYVHFLHEI